MLDLNFDDLWSHLYSCLQPRSHWSSWDIWDGQQMTPRFHWSPAMTKKPSLVNLCFTQWSLVGWAPSPYACYGDARVPGKEDGPMDQSWSLVCDWGAGLIFFSNVDSSDSSCMHSVLWDRIGDWWKSGPKIKWLASKEASFEARNSNRFWAMMAHWHNTTFSRKSWIILDHMGFSAQGSVKKENISDELVGYLWKMQAPASDAHALYETNH